VVPVKEDVSATVQNVPMATTVARLGLDGIVEAEKPYAIPVFTRDNYIEPESPFD